MLEALFLCSSPQRRWAVIHCEMLSKALKTKEKRKKAQSGLRNIASFHVSPLDASKRCLRLKSTMGRKDVELFLNLLDFQAPHHLSHFSKNPAKADSECLNLSLNLFFLAAPPPLGDVCATTVIDIFIRQEIFLCAAHPNWIRFSLKALERKNTKNLSSNKNFVSIRARTSSKRSRQSLRTKFATESLARPTSTAVPGVCALMLTEVSEADMTDKCVVGLFNRRPRGGTGKIFLTFGKVSRAARRCEIAKCSVVSRQSPAI